MAHLLPLLLAAACTLGDLHAPAVETVAAGVYALRLESRGDAEDRLVPARIGIVIGPRGVVVIDSGLSHDDGEAIVSAVARITPAPIRLVILTHPSQEAIFGASAFHERGIRVAMHREASALVASRCVACLERLRSTLGAEAMRHTSVVVPDRALADREIVEDAGIPLRILAPVHGSAPGALAVLDPRTSTLFSGSLASVRAVPDLRDADAAGWPLALDLLEQTRCKHLVPSHGALGSCGDIPAFARYLVDLEAHVAALLAQGVELGELDARGGMPRYEGWESYDTKHRANLGRTYLRLEHASLWRTP